VLFSTIGNAAPAVTPLLRLSATQVIPLAV